jgi:hypothetical protein
LGPLKNQPLELLLVIILYLNCRVIANHPRKLAIKRLVKKHKPSILLLQETIMDGDIDSKIVSHALPIWDFLRLDAIGCSGGPPMG